MKIKNAIKPLIFIFFLGFFNGANAVICYKESISYESQTPGWGYLKITDLQACCGASDSCTVSYGGDPTCSGTACWEL